MIQKSRLKNTFSTFIFGVFLFFAPFAIAEDSVPKAYAEFDLTHPFDGLAQSRAVDSYIESLGFDPDGYEALPIATERIEELFRRARLIKSVRNAPPGTSEKREILYTQQIPNELITLGLSKILLRAPTDEVLDFFVRHSISLEKGGSGPMPLVLWVGDPDCCYLDIYRNQVVGLLANSKAITISMLLASLCRTETIEKNQYMKGTC